MSCAFALFLPWVLACAVALAPAAAKSASREKFSEEYLDAEYGPVEEALVAAEFIAALGDRPAKRQSEDLQVLLKTNQGVRISDGLRKKAIRVVEHILANEASGGDDDMAAVRDLMTRLSP